jgi:hypothetical protein
VCVCVCVHAVFFSAPQLFPDFNGAHVHARCERLFPILSPKVFGVVVGTSDKRKLIEYAKVHYTQVGARANAIAARDERER